MIKYKDIQQSFQNGDNLVITGGIGGVKTSLIKRLLQLDTATNKKYMFYEHTPEINLENGLFVALHHLGTDVGDFDKTFNAALRQDVNCIIIDDVAHYFDDINKKILQDLADRGYQIIMSRFSEEDFSIHTTNTVYIDILEFRQQEEVEKVVNTLQFFIKDQKLEYFFEQSQLNVLLQEKANNHRTRESFLNGLLATISNHNHSDNLVALKLKTTDLLKEVVN